MENIKHIASNYKYPSISTHQCWLASSRCWVVVVVIASCLTEGGTRYEI